VDTNEGVPVVLLPPTDIAAPAVTPEAPMNVIELPDCDSVMLEPPANTAVPELISEVVPSVLLPVISR
jgi:hypothetical protein